MDRRTIDSVAGWFGLFEADGELDSLYSGGWVVAHCGVLAGEAIIVGATTSALRDGRRERPDLVAYGLWELRELMLRDVSQGWLAEIHALKRKLDGEIIPAGSSYGRLLERDRLRQTRKRELMKAVQDREAATG